MRTLIRIVLFLSPTLCFAQKMLESHEWCGKKFQETLPARVLLQDSRSDSFDIVRTDIQLNLLGLPQIKAQCTLNFKALLPGISSLKLDLEGLVVDSVRSGSGAPLVFSHPGNAVFVNFPQALPVGASQQISIFYHGLPVTDASGWGGYYNTSGTVFNLGVGFAADPHSFGRAWFPCFDNFVERCTFGVTILSPSGKKGYSNGALVQESNIPGGVSHTWEIAEPIPAYLACFASGNFTSFKRTYTGEAGPVYLEIAAAPGDTVKVRNSFQNLSKAIEAFEYWYGPFKWNKLGYTLVPFNSGAMEHATNIAIGSAYINGTLTYETLWAHEFSHHWWGDLATCTTAEDMWLNEGWASYSEHLFTEKVYGKTAFRNAVRANHLNVLQNAHISEGGYQAVSGVPHSLTYGTHVYNKGASVAHNLRGYLGDSLFRVGCRAAMATTSFDDWSSLDFQHKLEAATGQNLFDFFQDWVFSGGYADYTIDSLKLIYSPVDAPTIARIAVKQKLRGAPGFHHNVPLEFTFLMQDGQKIYRTALVSGPSTTLDFTFPAFGPAPVSVFVNTNLKLLLARSEGEKMLKSNGVSNFTEAKFNLTVNSLGADSVLFRVEHHFAPPDNAGANPNGYALTNRYWTIQTAGDHFPTGFDAQAILAYNGAGLGDQDDTELFAYTSPSEDSILLLYRPGAGHPWKQWPSYTKLTLGSTSDKVGQLRPTHLLPGEYTIGKGVSTIATKEIEPLGKISIAPNPTRGKVNLKTDLPFSRAILVGAEGQTEKSWEFSSANEATFDLENLPGGQYWLLLTGKNGTAICPLAKQ